MSLLQAAKKDRKAYLAEHYIKNIERIKARKKAKYDAEKLAKEKLKMGELAKIIQAEAYEKAAQLCIDYGREGFDTYTIAGAIRGLK